MGFIKIDEEYINIDYIVRIRDNKGYTYDETIIQLSNGEKIYAKLSIGTVMEKIKKAGKEVSK